MAWQIIPAALGTIALAAIYRRQQQRLRSERARYFENCLDLFSDYRVTQDGLHYAVLNGTYRGVQVRLEPIVDHMAWRKLPSLWLKVTVLKPLSVGSALGFLMRPNGAEYFSPTADLAQRISVPQSWPQNAILGVDDPATAASLDAISPHMSIFDDPKMKELVATPKGVRLVYQAAEASRSHYAVLREIRFDTNALDRDLASRLLDAALEISLSVAAARREAA